MVTAARSSISARLRSNHRRERTTWTTVPPRGPLVNDVTHFLHAIKRGDPEAAEQLWQLVYDELHRVAGALLARETPGQTLSATALVHEAYLRLSGDRD